MLNKGTTSLHNERHASGLTTAPRNSPLLHARSSANSSPVTSTGLSPVATQAYRKAQPPRLGFGLQDIFTFDSEQCDPTPIPPKPSAGFQLGAGLADFFSEENAPDYTPSKTRVAWSTTDIAVHSPSRGHTTDTHHAVPSAFQVDISDDDSDSDSDSSEQSLLEDHPYGGISKPSTPETAHPFTPSPGDKKSHFGTLYHESEATPVYSYPNFTPADGANIRLSDYQLRTGLEPKAQIPASSVNSEHETTWAPTITLSSGATGDPRLALAVTTTASPAVVSSYAALVASGPSIGDFTRLLNNKIDIGKISKPRSPPVLTPRELKWASLEKKLTGLIATDAEIDTNVHIYVDMSNIHIGFIDSWKLAHNVPVSQRIKAPKFSFENLARILGRDRPVSEKFLAGSVAFPATRRSNWPKHMKDAASMGYSMKIMERVLKEKSPSKHKVLGYSSIYDAVYGFATTSADDSTEDNAPSYIPSRNGEQGVDEGLHVEMLTTIIDHEEGTMVLATGDGAEAEFSQGFKSYAIRAMKRGWQVEVCAWKRTVSSAWSDPDFLAEWGDQFRLIHLDPFLDELVAETH